MVSVYKGGNLVKAKSTGKDRKIEKPTGKNRRIESTM
jgi:hypothetical protein